ncbi:MAG: FAD-binding protein [Fusobacterium sp.]|nr:FAD-binding protein [Fusobacterium sp.]
MLTSEKLTEYLSKVLPKSNILTGLEERYAYSQDALNIREIKNIADAVIFVENIEQIQAVVKLANKHKLPIICRGAGTNVVGACLPEKNGIILNFSKMNKILEINPANMTARVQSGVVVGDLQKEVEKFGLYYPPDPSNLAVSTVGGSIAQASAGAKAFKYGSTKDYVLDLTVVTANGEVLKTGSSTIKNATGYNLNTLFVGSEGTLGIVVEATLKLIPRPETKVVLMGYFDSVEASIQAVNSIIEHKITPATIDFMDKFAIQTVEEFKHAGLLTDKECALIIEVDGLSCAVDYQKNIIEKILMNFGAAEIQVSGSDAEYEKIWAARRASMAACTRLKPNVTTDDLIVPRENLSKLVLGTREICENYGLTVCMVGHVGDGSVHPQIPIDYSDEEEYLRFKKAKGEIYELTARLGGLLSGEHGIGMLKREAIGLVINETALNYMREIKKTFDPNNILNPYKIF